MKNLERGSKVEIIWEDSQHEFGWQTADMRNDSDPVNRDRELRVQSVGYVVSYTRNQIILAQSVDVDFFTDGFGQLDAVFRIPRRNIVKVLKL